MLEPGECSSVWLISFTPKIVFRICVHGIKACERTKLDYKEDLNSVSQFVGKGANFIHHAYNVKVLGPIWWGKDPAHYKKCTQCMCMLYCILRPLQIAQLVLHRIETWDFYTFLLCIF